jgi:hypothetical protein
MTTFEDVFEAFGGATMLASAIGIRPGHAQTMKSRGSIPPEYWSRIVNAARERRIKGVTHQALSQIAAQRLVRAS